MIRFLLPFAILLIIAISPGICQTQPALQNIIPVSPGVAALGKYGEIPVGYFTGIPNIDLPLYEINVKDITIPISLSYHAGGIKVEEMSSSCGLGFSLNAGGVISRQIRGSADDAIGGYMNNSNSDYQASNLVSGFLAQEKLVQIRNGGIDTEPDIYVFNFGKWSGKFFYDQASQKFYCAPHQKMIIQNFNNVSISGWVITVEDGTKFYFGQYPGSNQVPAPGEAPFHGESNNVSGSLCGEDALSSQTSWFLSKIVSPSSQEVNFVYESVSYRYQTLVSSSYSMLLESTDNGTSPNPLGSCSDSYIATNNIRTSRLIEINFPSGKVKFRSTNCRADLPGDKSLDFIEIFRNENLLKRYVFQYRYFGGDAYPTEDYCAVNPSSSVVSRANLLRLKLLSVSTESADAKERIPPYTFVYNSLSLPSRLSYAQDHWGYYNGASTNSTLVPNFIYNYNSRVIPIGDAANRGVNSAFTPMGILTKITYPTGGNTTFEYENNQVPQDQATNVVPNQVVSESLDLDIGPSDAYHLLTLHESIENDFTIANVADETNGFKGGAYVDYTCTNIRCDEPQYGFCVFVDVYDNAGNVVLRLTEKTEGTVFLPNGDYKVITSLFANTPSTVQLEGNFFAGLKWTKVVPGNNTGGSNNAVVGGLRIKKMVDSDASGMASVKYFKYETDEIAQLSSGSLLNLPNYTYVMKYSYRLTAEQINAYATAIFLIRNGYSNYPLATSQSSYVCYNKVSVYYGDSNGSDGKSTYEYGFEPDDQNADLNSNLGFPFAPPASNESLRGLLISATDYKKAGDGFLPIKTTHNSYRKDLIGISFGIKIGQRNIVIQGTDLEYQAYRTRSYWVYQSQSLQRDYDMNDAAKYVETITNYTRNPLNLQISKVSQALSDGSVVNTYLKYPADFTDGNPVVTDMASDNRFLHNSIIQKTGTRVKDGVEKVDNSTITRYAYLPSENNSTLIVPIESAALEISSPVDINDEVAFPAYRPSSGLYPNNFKRKATYWYDSRANIIQQQKENDAPVSYIWGYNYSYPVAEIKNATYQNVLTALGQSVLDQLNSNPGTDEQVRQSLNALRASTSLKNTLITTYTYDPLVGTTSQTDANNVTTYYEYDGLGRLKLIRDKGNYILKKYEYEYQIK